MLGAVPSGNRTCAAPTENAGVACEHRCEAATRTERDDAGPTGAVVSPGKLSSLLYTTLYPSSVFVRLDK
jgi:hypothetical protein